MKRLVRLFSVVIVTIFLFTSCGSGLSGKYVDNSNRTLVFEGRDKVTFGGTKGTYSISNGKITFIFSGNVQEYSYSKVSDSLVIDGIAYKKK